MLPLWTSPAPQGGLGLHGFSLPLHSDPGDQPLPFTLATMFTRWEWNWWVVVPLVISLGLYLAGVRKLHKRGDAWPLRHIIPWVAGHVVAVIATLSSLGVYDTVLFSIHMVQHMLLSMIVPVFLAQGAPMTLALRTLTPRPRALLLTVLHSFVAKVLLFPPLTMAAMILTPFFLYPTGLYELTLRNDVAHDLLHVWMVVVGCAFFWPLLGTDPTPWKLVYPIRILLLFLTMPFHAFVGTMIMGSKELIAESWYVAFNRTWGPSPIDDQYAAGGILWATGDLTMFTTMSALFLLWLRDSQREARQQDRALDRAEETERRAAAAAAAVAVGRYDATNPAPASDEE